MLEITRLLEELEVQISKLPESMAKIALTNDLGSMRSWLTRMRSQDVPAKMPEDDLAELRERCKLDAQAILGGNAQRFYELAERIDNNISDKREAKTIGCTIFFLLPHEMQELIMAAPLVALLLADPRGPPDSGHR
jgi:hypothetical protein